MEQIQENITILQRNLTGLKDAIGRVTLSKGQQAFINVYLEIISEHIEKSLDVIDEDRYREALKYLED